MTEGRRESAPAEGPEPKGPEPVEGVLDRSLALVAFLREHCPWDRDQTPRSLVPHLIEESREVVDAILGEDHAELEGELGDLLLNLAFQIVIGEEENHFSRRSVADRLEEKMRRRHPHLFDGGEKEEWEVLKLRERKEGEGALAGLASGLDPLLAAHRMQEKAGGVGFDWDEPGGALDKVAEELEEVREALAGSSSEDLEEELGDLLFSVVNLTRLAGRHASLALERANRKFRTRFERLEMLAAERGVRLEDATLEALDRIWDDVKAEERRTDR